MIRLLRLSAGLVALAIVYLSLLTVGVPSADLYTDKVNHFIAYAVLTALIGLGWPKLHPLALVALAFFFGVAMEIAQAMGSMGRTASLLDALANLAGAVVVSVILFILRKK